MNRFLILSLVLASAVVLTGCNNTQARHSDGKTITFTLENKHRNLLGDSEAHTDWLLETDKGKFNPYYRAIGEFDPPLGRSKLYKELQEGRTYSCQVAGQERAALQQYPVVKDCQEI